MGCWLLTMLGLDFANDFFHQFLNGDQAFRAGIFVKHNGQMGSFGPHFGEKIKHAHGFGHIERLPDKHSETGGGWLTPSQYRESIANMDHADFGNETTPIDRYATMTSLSAQGHQLVEAGAFLYGGDVRAGNGNVVRCRSEQHTSELAPLMRITYDVFCSKKKI